MNVFRRRAAWLALAALLTVAAAWLLAHEGHGALPTRGAQVDGARGLLTLSREARDALDVRTAEVKARPVRETVLAYATLVSPWRQHAFASSRLPGRIARMQVQPGQHVEAGQALAEVASLELESLQLEILNIHNELRRADEVLRGLEA